MEMNKTILRGVMLLIFFSCNERNKIQELNKSINYDSLYSIKPKLELQAVKELDPNFVKEDQIKAIGDIDFGMTKSEAKLHIRRFMKESIKTWQFGEFNQIGGFHFNNVYDEYYKGKLFYLKVKGDSSFYSDQSGQHGSISDIELKVEKVSTLLKKKFGEPHYLARFPTQDHSLPPYFPEFYKDDVIVLQRWEIGKKRIDILLEKAYNHERTELIDSNLIHIYNNYLIVSVEIYLPEIVNEINVNKKMKKGEDDKKKSDFDNNAF